MKVVINKCYGGFGLSDKAVEACIALGMTVGDEEDHEDKDFIKFKELHFGHRYYINKYGKGFRCDTRLIKVVEQLGKEADGKFAKLEVIEIPFNSCDGWYIHEYDGIENIEESHRSWG